VQIALKAGASLPALVGHSVATGSFAFHVPRDDLYLVGSFNQLDQARRSYTKFLMNVLKSVEKHSYRR